MGLWILYPKPVYFQIQLVSLKFLRLNSEFIFLFMLRLCVAVYATMSHHLQRVREVKRNGSLEKMGFMDWEGWCIGGYGESGGRRREILFFFFFFSKCLATWHSHVSFLMDQ